MIPTATRADLHCHSTASQLSKLGIQRSLGLPECATPPEEVYELAKRRGMDFVTITDHDTIAGVLEIADRTDVFISEELTVWFKGEPQAVHVLCHDITPDDHDWLQAHNDDVEACAAYLREHDIAATLAHPFYAVEAPLQPRHRRRLAQLFGTWETRNGSRARELNAPAAVYIETHGGTGIGGSDDHAGVDIGRTFTETPAAATPEQFLAHIRAGRATARGEQGSAAKWAHAAMGLASRVLARDANGRPDPQAVLKMVERVVTEGDARSSVIGVDLGPDDARNLLAAWLKGVDLDMPTGELLGLLQSEDFSHAALHRRARRIHERKLRTAVASTLDAAATGGDLGAVATEIFDACIPAIPYVPATLFLGSEKGKLAARDSEPRRVALVADAVGGMHGVTHTLDELRERGLPGYEIEVIGTDPNVDRRLPAVAEVPIPFYPGLQIGVPSLPAITEAIAEGRYDLVHLCSPGPSGVAAALLAKVAELPIVGSYHTELAAYAGVRTNDPRLELGMKMALGAFYGACGLVLSPSEASDASLRELGIAPERIGRWDRGVDVSRFDPNQRVDGLYGPAGRVNVLYAGRLTSEKGVDLLADAFLAARRRDERLHLVLAGGGPEEDALGDKLGEHATFLGWLEGEGLAQAYASADMFLFASRTDTFGNVILEAQASGIPVVAVAEGGPLTLIRDGVDGLLREADAEALGTAVAELAAAPQRRRRLAHAALGAVRARTWERSLGQLAEGYGRALATTTTVEAQRAA
jgi:glycosyltransferase involved in cell wall biosynthesis/predicted metal-dependent phosphoesterase TrpH